MVCDAWKKNGKYWFYYDKKGKRRFGKVKTTEGIVTVKGRREKLFPNGSIRITTEKMA